MYKDFEKWHGCHNDFVIIYSSAHEVEMIKTELIKLAPRLCSKSGNGIGADGILLLQTKLPDDPLAEKLTIINSDGSIALNCGNGIRVAALSNRKRFLARGQSNKILEYMSLEVETKIFNVRFSVSSTNKIPLVHVEMGKPCSNINLEWHNETLRE